MVQAPVNIRDHRIGRTRFNRSGFGLKFGTERHVLYSIGIRFVRPDLAFLIPDSTSGVTSSGTAAALWPQTRDHQATVAVMVCMVKTRSAQNHVSSFNRSDIWICAFGANGYFRLLLTSMSRARNHAAAPPLNTAPSLCRHTGSTAVFRLHRTRTSGDGTQGWLKKHLSNRGNSLQRFATIRGGTVGVSQAPRYPGEGIVWCYHVCGVLRGGGTAAAPRQACAGCAKRSRTKEHWRRRRCPGSW